MKKLILMAAVAIFSLGASAQKLKPVADLSLLNKVNLSEGQFKTNVKVAGLKDGVELTKKAQTRINEDELPANGVRKDYFLFYSDYVNQAGLFNRGVKQTLVFDDATNTVYIPLMMLNTSAGLDGVYIPCRRQATDDPNMDQVIVPNQYVVGQALVGGYAEDVMINQLNFMTQDGEPLETEGVLFYDKATGALITGSYQIKNEGGQIETIPVYYGIYQGNDLKATTMCCNLVYYPINDEFFDKPVTRPFTFMNNSNEIESGIVTEYSMPAVGLRFFNGLFNDYKNSWAIMAPTSEDLTANTWGMPSQYVDESVWLVDGEPIIQNGEEYISYNVNTASVFDYDAVNDTYSQQDGEYMYAMTFDSNYMQHVPFYGYSQITFGKATPTGINNVTTSTDKEAVATEYYDLSGRRVSAAEKGVTIKVEKYADGTSKATKVMK